ncbi:HNH endonuclease [Delftia deserti]|uniref:HNH endonuclease n=1 Tax=Delftia deserti TaxID=1651218 RepID=A0ABW5EYF0_9BURK
MTRPHVTPEYVRDVLDYNPETGEMLWKVKVAMRTVVGERAGSVSSLGSRVVKLKNLTFQCKRVAWMHYYGEEPSEKIRLRNNDQNDLSIKNLVLHSAYFHERNHDQTSDGDISAERLRRLFHYDPETGIFTRKFCGTRGRIGTKAGGLHTSQGKRYRSINIDGRFFKLHRLAWLYVHGEWPKGVIDHIDGDGENNSLSNLRDVTPTINSQNIRAVRRRTLSGYLGVSWSSEKKAWFAYIKVDKKRQYLGYFDDPEVAHQAYLDAKRRLHPGCTI